MKREEILLVYDRECPACNAYSRLVRIREGLGDLRIVDARESNELTKEITALGFDINEGMVLKIGPSFYNGSDAIHALALISSRSDLFNRINYRLFKSKTVSTLLYPILRFLRNCLLKILGKTRINNSYT